MDDAQRQCPVRDAVSIRGHLVAGLSAPAPSKFSQLRVDVRKGQGVRLEQHRVAQPRRMPVDLEPYRSEEPRFTKVVPGQLVVLSALPIRVEQEQR